MSPPWWIQRIALAVIALAVCALAFPAAASPWTRPPGGVFLENRLDYFTVRDALLAIDRLETNVYAEWGVVPGVMLGGKAAYAEVSGTIDGAAFSQSGVSEIEGFVQATLLRSSLDTLSVKVSGGGLRRIENGEADGFSRDGADIEARLLYGRDLRAAPFKVFAAAETGYRKRLGENADEWRADALIGIEPTDRLLILAEAMASFSLGNERGDGADFDVIRLKPSAIYRFSNRWAVRLGASFDVAARNLIPGRTISVGFWTTF